MKYFRRVLPYLKPYWKLALVSVLATVLTAAIGLLSPWPLQILLDNVLGRKPLPELLASLAGDPVNLLIFAVVAGLVVTLLSNALSIISNYVNTRLENRIVLDFRCDLFAHAQRLSVPYADQVSTGRMMYGINFEADAAGGLIMAIQPLAQSALTLVGMFWVSMQIDSELALLSLIVVPFLYYSVGFYTKRIQPRLLATKGMEADALSVVHEALQMLRVIAAFGRESYHSNRYRVAGGKAVDSRVKLTVSQTIFSLAVNMTTAIGTALVLGVGAYHALEGKLSVGQLLVVMAYIAAVYKPLEAISFTIGSLQDRFVALGMAFHVLDTKPDIEDTPKATKLGRASGNVTFEDVSFSYPGRTDTLKDISFDIKAGQVVAVVGPTGAGKTTLMSLIPRFYDPVQGRVLIDGHDVRSVTLSSLREQISLVPQEPVLFSGTIADNIRYGRFEATMDEVIEAAKSANAHEFIMALPEQYETMIGERGARLSGGERQRICVARAFLKDAPILILDEPTSAIDSKTESVILDALDRLMLGRTTFMIAHRLSTVRHSDVILVLNRGELVEQGTHDELLERDGLYKHLYEMQIASRQNRRQKLLPFMQEIEELLVRSDGHHPNGNNGNGHTADGATLELPAIEASREANAALFVSQSVPETMVAGHLYTVSITLRNTGAQAWSADDNYKLGSQNPHDNITWGTSRINLPESETVAPGGELALSFDIAAPTAPGRYDFQWRLLQEGVCWFGDVTPNVEVNVVPEEIDVIPSPAGDLEGDAEEMEALDEEAAILAEAILLAGESGGPVDDALSAEVARINALLDDHSHSLLLGLLTELDGSGLHPLTAGADGAGEQSARDIVAMLEEVQASLQGVVRVSRYSQDGAYSSVPLANLLDDEAMAGLSRAIEAAEGNSPPADQEPAPVVTATAPLPVFVPEVQSAPRPATPPASSPRPNVTGPSTAPLRPSPASTPNGARMSNAQRLARKRKKALLERIILGILYSNKQSKKQSSAKKPQQTRSQKQNW